MSRVELAINQPADLAKPNPWWTRADEDEARWNYAFWLQNRLGMFPGDQNQRDLLDRWLRVSGLWFEEPANPDEWASLGLPITTRFVEICVKVAQLLHSAGDIAGLFGRTIPVVVHELEYYDRIADQTLQANPPGVADEFAAWVSSRSYGLRSR